MNTFGEELLRFVWKKCKLLFDKYLKLKIIFRHGISASIVDGLFPFRFSHFIRFPASMIFVLFTTPRRSGGWKQKSIGTFFPKKTWKSIFSANLHSQSIPVSCKPLIHEIESWSPWEKSNRSGRIIPNNRTVKTFLISPQIKNPKFYELNA